MGPNVFILIGKRIKTPTYLRNTFILELKKKEVYKVLYRCSKSKEVDCCLVFPLYQCVYEYIMI